MENFGGNIGDLTISVQTRKAAEVGKIYDRFSYPRLSSAILQYKMIGVVYVVYTKRENNLINCFYFGLLKDKKSLMMVSFWSLGHPGYREDLHKSFSFILKNLPVLKIEKLLISYRSNYKTAEIIESMRQKFQWPEPIITNYFAKIDQIPGILDSPWLKREIPQTISISKLNKQNAKDLAKSLQSKEWKNEFPSSLDPFQIRTNIDPHTSFILKENDKIMGWLICHVMGKNKIQVTSLFVKKSLPAFMGLRLIGEMYDGLKNSGRENAGIQYLMEATNVRMIAMTKRVLNPLGVKLHSILNINVDLTDDEIAPSN